MIQRSQVGSCSPFVCIDNRGEQMSEGLTLNPSLLSSQWSRKNTTMEKVQQFISDFHGLKRNVWINVVLCFSLKIDFLEGGNCSIRWSLKLNHNFQFRRGQNAQSVKGWCTKMMGFFTYKKGFKVRVYIPWLLGIHIKSLSVSPI